MPLSYALQQLIKCCLLVGIVVVSYPAQGAADAVLATSQQQLAASELQVQKTKHLESLKSKKISESTLELANLELETARVALGSLELELENLTQQIELEETSNTGSEKKAKENEGSGQELTAHREELAQAVESQRRRVKIIEDWAGTLKQGYDDFASQSSQEAWEIQQSKLIKQRDGYLKQAKNLKAQLAKMPADGNLEKTRSLRINILEADERASLISQQIQIKASEIEIEKLTPGFTELDHATEEQLLEAQSDALSVAQEMGALGKIIVRKQELLMMYQGASSLLSKRQQTQVNSLSQSYNDQLVKINTLSSQSHLVQSAVAEQLQGIEKQKLSTRYSWPDAPSDWGGIITDFKSSFFTLAEQSLEIVKRVSQQSTSMLIRTLLLILVSIGVLTLIRAAITDRLPELNRSESSYSQWMSSLYIHMVRRNLYTLFVLGTVPVVAWMLDIPFELYRVLFWILVVIMFTKPLLNLNHTLYEQRKNGLEWYDKPLFLSLRGSVVLGAGLVILSIISRHTDVSAMTTEVTSRLLMVGMLLASLVILWRRKAILSVFAEALADRPRIYFLLRLASLAFPLAGFLTGFIGLLGYTNFAWMLAYHEGVVLAVAAGWMTVRGFVIDFFKTWYSRSTHKLPNGWIWAQAVIRPLELLSRVLLILSSIILTFRIFGWSEDSTVGGRISQILQQPLFSIGDTNITLGSVLIVVFASSFFLWAAKWSREFAYRWVYRRMNDHGIRNSLAVFTQYAVVLVGLFILLKILGIDLTALAVLAGAIGVGIGFGLQTIANNFISGILLLLERPFKTGDIINIGGNEGEVTRIGIRSLSVKTWDNTEVIIPNTDTMASAFVNWTHHDNVIRVKDYIGVSYDADPHRVQEIILALIEGEDDICSHPEPKVWLDAFADSSVNFRVQFFVDIDKHTHLEVKSRLWFKIWDAFKEEGIEIPFPQQDLHLRTITSDANGKFSA